MPAEIKPLTLQEAFDTIWQKFVVEGAPRAYDKHDASCKYRLPGGARCFIGVLIPDELYEPSFESEGSISAVMYERPKIKALLPFEPDVISQLQGIHDMYGVTGDTPGTFSDHCRERLTAFAEQHSLTVPFG